MFPASIFKLDNGLTLIHQEIPTTPVVVADVWVSAGSVKEPNEGFGIAHFLEHMIFKGTANVQKGVFDSNIENQGGVSNAATSYDYAHYSITSTNSYLHSSFEQLAEMLLNAAIPDDELERERDVVLEEIRSYNDDPDWVGYQHLVQNIYQKHPYGRSILGCESDIEQHSSSKMRAFHRTYYRPENMTVVIVGGIPVTPALELVENTFKSNNLLQQPLPFDNDNYNHLNLNDVEETVEPFIAGIRRQEISLPRLENARLMMAWTSPGVDELTTACGLDLLSVLLASGRTSRLIRDLREEQQLVRYICCNFSLQKESSLFTISAVLEPENLERVETAIKKHLQDIITNGISEQELRRAQRLLCNDFAFSTETPNQLAGLYGYYNTVSNIELAVTYPDQILSFNTQELQKLALLYLSPNQYAVTTLKPSTI